MKIKLYLIAIVILLSGCSCHTESVKGEVTNKSYSPPSTGLCVKTGNIYVPMNGGSCIGMLETIPEKYTLYMSYDDGTSGEEKVDASEYYSTEIGQPKSKRITKCK